MTSPKIHPPGPPAFVWDAPPPATLECQRRMWALADAARLWPHVVEVVPGMNNLTLVFDPLQLEQTDLALQLKNAWDEALEADVGTTEIEIPVRYGGAEGPGPGSLGHP